MKGIPSRSIVQMADKVDIYLDWLGKLARDAKLHQDTTDGVHRRDVGLLVCSVMWELGDARTCLALTLNKMGFFQAWRVKKYLKARRHPQMDAIFSDTRRYLVPWMQPQ